jgi:hypothetical protein
MSLSRILTVALASLTLTFAAAAPARDAEACGGYMPEKTAAQIQQESDASDAVHAHFKALAKGDARAVRKQWAVGAKITAFDRQGVALRTEKLGKALPRWIKAREGLEYTITNAYQTADGAVTIVAHVTWNGTLYDDVLTVERQGDTWRITSKSTYSNHEEPQVATKFSGY